ncbi:MAG: VRR-NUC domain-containing protein [Bacteroidales bacterium]|nr:VRR-NUC domain-containing protein [Bacteroidales bacterium]
MTTEQTEGQFQSAVIELAHMFGWRIAHFRAAQTAKGWRTPVQADGKGFPDLVLARERLILAELKSERGRLSDAQREWIEALERAGAEVYCWRPSQLEEIADILRRRARVAA